VDASDEIETLRAEIEKLKAERDEAREWGVQREFELSSKLAAAREEAKVYRSTLEKIADPRKRDHREPDKYTECACIMNMADEALAQFPEKKRV
jgi:chromosome segregation ATPase